VGFNDILDKELHNAGAVEVTAEVVEEAKKEISVKQKPVIEYSKVESIGKDVDIKLKKLNLDKLEPTEDNKSKLKLVRADLKKELAAFETDRKNIKSIVLNPYNQFEEAYKQHIKSKYEEADTKLKDAIDLVEDKQKEKIKSDVLAYYAEVTLDKDLDAYVKFDDLNINITLSASMKSYKDTIDAFVKQVEQDLQVIETHENKDRLRAKYLKCKNLHRSMIELSEELEHEKSFKPIAQEPVIQTSEPIDLALDEVLSVSFTATAKRSLLRQLKQFMNEKGIKYE